MSVSYTASDTCRMSSFISPTPPPNRSSFSPSALSLLCSPNSAFSPPLPVLFLVLMLLSSSSSLFPPFLLPHLSFLFPLSTPFPCCSSASSLQPFQLPSLLVPFISPSRPAPGPLCFSTSILQAPPPRPRGPRRPVGNGSSQSSPIRFCSDSSGCEALGGKGSQGC